MPSTSQKKEGLWNLSLGEIGATLKVLQDHGVTLRLFARLRSDKDYAEQVAKFMLRGGEASETQKRAREIMRENFFGIEEAVKHFEVNPTNEQLAALSEIPFSEITLKQLKKTHILVALFPLSIIEIRKKVGFKFFCEQSWYETDIFAHKHGEVCWKLVRKTPVPDSACKTWTMQQLLLDKNEETPTAQVMVYTIIGYYLVTGKLLFKRFNVRTSCMVPGNNHVSVGNYHGNGLSLNSRYGESDMCGYGYTYEDNGLCRNYLGLSSARKF